MKYAVIYETGPEGGQSAYVPDLQCCLAPPARSRKFAH